MYESKYSGFLTILLIIVIIAIIACLVFGGYKVYEQFNSTKDANDFVNSYVDNTSNNIDINVNTNTDGNNTTGGNSILDQLESTPIGNGSSGNGSTQTYKGYNVIGTIQIPKINLSYPILDEATTSAIEVSVAMLYGAGPNQPGNTLIIGHNYRNGQFFANNKNLSKGDKIYITDSTGKKLTYTIYDKFETTTEDTEFITRNTNGAREISLQTCTDDGVMRLILLARCDLDS